jgi:hypothetical protein
VRNAEIPVLVLEMAIAGPNKFRGLDHECAMGLLLTLNIVKSLTDLSPLRKRGVSQAEGRPEKPTGNDGKRPLADMFRFSNCDAYNGTIVDYHKG